MFRTLKTLAALTLALSVAAPPPPSLLPKNKRSNLPICST